MWKERDTLSLTLHEVRDLTSPSNMTGHVCTCIAIVSLYMYEQNEFRFYLTYYVTELIVDDIIRTQSIQTKEVIMTCIWSNRERVSFL